MFKFFRKLKNKIINRAPLEEEIQIDESFLELENKAMQFQMNSIVIHPQFNSDQKIPIGSSKIGGKPDLPPDFEWFHYQRDSLFTGVVANRPLSFLAQINLEEVEEFDLDNKLPNTGILYFFYEMESGRWGFDPIDKGCARVYYYKGNLDQLVRTDFPAGLNDEYIFPEISLSFSTKINIPPYEEQDLCHDYRIYNKIQERNGLTEEVYSSKLLGYADIIQNDMTIECELVTNGIYCGDATDKSEKRKELEAHKSQWKLLFQLESLYDKKIDLSFGDAGRVYYYIKEDDLLNRNFDDVWFILQCT